MTTNSESENQSLYKGKSETDLKFENVDSSFRNVEKRIDDLKWTLGGAMAFFGLIFSVAAYIFNANFTAEKQNLRESADNLRKELLGKEFNADLELQGLNKKALAQQIVIGTIATNVENNKIINRLNFPVILKNSGESPTGSISLKLYSIFPLQFEDTSSDESKYGYESFLATGSVHPNNLPAKSSGETHLFIDLRKIPSPGDYQVLLKGYCENTKTIEKEEFIIRIMNQ